jgi:hypothetical protein
MLKSFYPPPWISLPAPSGKFLEGRKDTSPPATGGLETRESVHLRAGVADELAPPGDIAADYLVKAGRGFVAGIAEPHRDLIARSLPLQQLAELRVETA